MLIDVLEVVNKDKFQVAKLWGYPPAIQLDTCFIFLAL